jgi:hypothetical protein
LNATLNSKSLSSLRTLISVNASQRYSQVGEELPLTGELFVKPFQTYHVVPSQGYVVYSRRQKLKPEYVGLPGQEIGRLKRSGVQVGSLLPPPLLLPVYLFLLKRGVRMWSGSNG